MPYYAWRGVTLQGTIKRGRQFASSLAQLDARLLKRDIALLATRTKNGPRFSRAVTLAQKIDLLRSLSDLLKAGVLLPDALVLLSEQAEHPRLQAALCLVADDVHHGQSLSEALRKHPAIFDSLTVQMAKVGQETGAVDATCAVVSDHFQMLHDFRKQLRGAALMPCMTFGFFVLIAAVIFMVIIPRFADLFQAMHQDLPFMTQLLIRVSAALRGVGLVVWCGVLSAGALALHAYQRSQAGKRRLSAMALRLPLIGPMLKNCDRIYFLRSTAMLVEGGVPLVSALRGAQAAVNNHVTQNCVSYLADQVEAGSSLSQAMAGMPEPFFDAALIAIVHVGEESGTLGAALHKAAARYHARVRQSLNFFSTVFQPLLMIIMGLLVTALIFAVYLPIFNLANVVG